MVDAPFLGEGVYLRFNLNDMVEVEEVFGTEWWMLALGRLEAGEREQTVPAKLVDHLLKVGAKKNGERVAVDIEALDLPRVYRPLMEAISLATAGVPFDDLVAKIQARAAKAEEELKAEEERRANPPKPDPSSKGSGSGPTAQGSGRTNSGG